MKSFGLVLASVGLTALCWGVYGPVLHTGQGQMGGDRWLPFLCVGLAYFVIAVAAPLVVLRTKGEKGVWTTLGTAWSLAAGAAGALGGQLGIILAFTYRGNPLYVMPLVFGCAPVINTFFTMVTTGTFRNIKPMFLGALVLVALGAAGVMFFKPAQGNIHESVEINTDDATGKVAIRVTSNTGVLTSYDAPSAAALPADAKRYYDRRPLAAREMLYVTLSVALTALMWGVYGPVLHKGQMKMQGSRLRPLLCVGLAYFLIAVLAPLPMYDWSKFTIGGGVWSLAGGAAGAVGALGIILAFTFGGKPIYVMPLVFGGAPVVNTFTTLLTGGGLENVNLKFIIALLMVMAGAVMVLIFAPKADHGPAPVSKREETATPAAAH